MVEQPGFKKKDKCSSQRKNHTDQSLWIQSEVTKMKVIKDNSESPGRGVIHTPPIDNIFLPLQRQFGNTFQIVDVNILTL